LANLDLVMDRGGGRLCLEGESDECADELGCCAIAVEGIESVGSDGRVFGGGAKLAKNEYGI